MTIGSENLSNGLATSDRFTGGKYRGARRNGGTAVDEAPEAADLTPLDGPAPDEASTLPSVSLPDAPATLPALGGLTEPTFPSTSWPDSSPADLLGDHALVDHPLLRGLLMELPPKGTVPGTVWLDRWFEAARAILELLYVQDPGRAR